MTQNSKQIQIDFIISCIKKGESRAEILVKVGNKWGTSKSAFDRLLKIAKEQHAIAQQVIKAELEKLEKQAAINARKKEIMTSEERKMVLTKIANGRLKLTRWWIGKDYQVSKQVVPNYTERISAIAELNKMEGDYAPIKTALTDKDGEDIDLSKLPVVFR